MFIDQESVSQTLMNINRTADEIHADNVKAGRWTDITDPDNPVSILETRNRGEIMMLIMSELFEAYTAGLQDAYDDHLPDFAGFDVELADTAIRQLDLIGAERSRYGRNMSSMFTVGTMVRQYDGFCDQAKYCKGDYAATVNMIGVPLVEAFEHLRKGRTGPYMQYLGASLLAVIAVAEVNDVPLDKMIAAKRAYNAQRADHKIDNRRAVGGKAF